MRAIRRSEPRGASRIGAVSAATAALLGCAAAVDESPRMPYAPPAPPPIAEADGSFRVQAGWRWSSVAAAGVQRFGASALQSGRLGLYDAASFELAPGDCADCGASDLIGWWLGDELVAVPKPGGARRSSGEDRPPAPLPDGVWVGAPERVHSARLADGGRALSVGEREILLAVTPPIETNAAYVDASTARFFADKPLIVRGASTTHGGEDIFVARTIFPDDRRIDLDAPLMPLRRNELLATLVEAQSGPSQRLLYARSRGSPAGRYVFALVLTGAQGDDDGARAGHLAAATGVLGGRGEWHDWLVTNFYPLLDGNAKGIVPASVPIDNYLYDLNSGQLYYRPGYLLVAVLRERRVAAEIERALGMTLRRLYCGDIEFDRARRNSTAMTIDPLRGLGWRIPRTGPTSRIAGLAAAPFAALVQRSFAAARGVYGAFAAEKTRLLPRAAFEVAGHDLLRLASLGDVGEALDDLTPFERMLAEDIEAVVLVRLPQVPSSRRFGTYPAASLLAYGAALLSDPAPYEGAPDARPRRFSDHLRASCPAQRE